MSKERRYENIDPTEIVPRTVAERTELVDPSPSGATERYADPEKTVYMPQALEEGAAEKGADASPGSGADDGAPVVGWVVVVKGPGRGKSRTLSYGNNAIGRGPDMRVRLDFGDQRISREAHAYVVYDEVGRRFFLRDSGQVNLVRLNDGPVMGPVPLSANDRITIGETVLAFVPFCGSDFDWLVPDDGQKPNG